MCGLAYRARLERAMFEAGFDTDEEFAEAVGCKADTVSRWLRCLSNPGPVQRRAIARVLELSPGADCDEVVESDLDWLLEPCDGSTR